MFSQGLLVEKLELVDHFIASVNATKSAEAVFIALRQAVQRCGFESMTYALLIPPGSASRPQFFTNYSASWIDHYNEQRYEQEDLVFKCTVRAVRPLLWSEIMSARDLTPIQQRLLSESREAGLRAGALVPLHGPGPAKACFTVAGNVAEPEFAALFAEYLHAIHLMAIYAHDRIIDQWDQSVLETPRLTPRETEIMTWTALGKTRRDIAGALNLSDETVKDHLERACQRLGALNKTHAVTIALKHSLINP